MKKLFSFFVIACVAVGAFADTFAKKWTNNVGGGITGNFSQVGIARSSVDDVVTQVGGGIEGIYLGYHENGFTAKADYSVGVTTTKNVNLQDKDTNVGLFTNIAFGVGYSVPVSEKFLLSFTGMFGADVSVFSDKKEGVTYYYDDTEADDDADYVATAALITLSLGTDVLAKYSLSEHFGIFANVELRWVVGGIESDETTYTYYKNNRHKEYTDQSDNEFNLFGRFRVQPAIGVIWTF